MPQIDLPGKIRLSRWAKVVEQRVNPERPLVVLSHTLSGNSLRVSRATADFVLSLPKEVSRTKLLQKVDQSSQVVLRLLAERHLLVDADVEDEFALFSAHFPLWSPGIVAHEVSGGLSFFSHHSEKEIILRGWEREFVLLCDGKLTLAELVKIVDQPLKKVFHLVERLVDLDFQILRLSPVAINDPLFQSGAGLDFFIENWSHTRAVREEKEAANRNGTIDLEKFHQEGIPEAFHEFNEVEITLAHAFREPNPVLGGLSYGAAFFQMLKRWHWLGSKSRVLEVGGGTGVFAREFQCEAKRQGTDLQYTIVDLSPVLQASQREQNKELSTRFILQNAEHLKVPAQSIDLLVSNEVIADFRAVRLRKADLRKRKLSGNVGRAVALIRKYGIPMADAPEEFYFNFGAALFLERMAKALAPGGIGVVTEFGGFSFPQATHHLNHDEYSIHWGHLLHLARALGLEANLYDLGTILPFNHQAMMFDGDVFRINKILRKFGRPGLSPRAYSREEMEKALALHRDLNIRGLSYSPFYEENYWGPALSDFQALVAQKRK